MSVLNEEVAARLTGHLRNDTTDLAPSDLHVPISHFVSEERAAAERGALKRVPLIVAHGSEIAAPGAFITREVLGIPLIIVRRSDESVAAYVNMCRHRGGRVEYEACGSKRVFMCQYHGWSYGRDNGELRHVPYEEFFDPIDHKTNGLHTVKAEEAYGFIWLDFSHDENRTVAEYLGPQVGSQLDEFALDRCETFLDRSFTLDINWKIVLDGAIDVLHPKFLHPTGVGKLIETNTSAWESYGRHGQSFSPRRKMTKLVKENEQLDGLWKYIGSNMFIYPNSMVIAAPDHVEFWTVWPDVNNPSRSTTHIRFLVRPEILDEAMTARLNKSWSILEQAAKEEDWPMEQTIQENSKAWPDGYYRYGRNEQSCQHLHRQLARDIDGVTG
ncbi:aromatic ring-hydroxylating oxygenase subunit alpha [Amycolatopsis acidicola]|uniref:aromatic ring-hydroxylating oxygenase subunit alpha n=1 Tax=Amycolatopsis acidicola TaxID=2596893 RepID=UPI001407E1D3|nr:aromatic ring-hydroxylating dioxygenase subunit alpha [Amycolatopsis acidicola]